MKIDIYILFFFKEYFKVCIFFGYFKKYLVKYMEKVGLGYQMIIKLVVQCEKRYIKLFIEVKIIER